MDNKKIYKLSKRALKTPWLYSEKELSYLKKSAKAAKQGMKIDEMRKMFGEDLND